MIESPPESTYFCRSRDMNIMVVILCYPCPMTNMWHTIPDCTTRRSINGLLRPCGCGPLAKRGSCVPCYERSMTNICDRSSPWLTGHPDSSRRKSPPAPHGGGRRRTAHKKQHSCQKDNLVHALHPHAHTAHAAKTNKETLPFPLRTLWMKPRSRGLKGPCKVRVAVAPTGGRE